MKTFNSTFLLRFGVAIILLSHSLHGIFTDGDVNNFGNLFFNKIGFSPVGVYIAWGVVLSQVITAILLLANKFVKIACIINILILLAGIVLVHFPEGWYVVGAGRNGIEFSFILLIVLLAIIFPQGMLKKNQLKV